MNLYIDFGGTNFKYSFDNEEIIVLESAKVDLVTFLEEQISLKKGIKNIAISFAGQVRDGVILNAPNIDLKELYIKRFIEDKYEINVIVENDLNAATIYEYSKFQDINSMIVLYIGTGFGCGIVIGDKVLYGKDNFAGEIGHIPFRKTNHLCQCGRDDCLELSTSGKALRGLRLNEIDAQTKQIFLDGLVHSFFTVLNLLNCEVYVLGGSVISNNIWLLDFLQEEYKKSSFYKLRGELKMVLSDSQYGNLEGLKIIASQQQTKDKTNGKI
ncbi:MAG: ROK family protein [Arcobacteraceae bacterium]|jgi:glucokinase|nr:ROK family protein [Arcobacteraceae bacterium]